MALGTNMICFTMALASAYNDAEKHDCCQHAKPYLFIKCINDGNGFDLKLFCKGSTWLINFELQILQRNQTIAYTLTI